MSLIANRRVDGQVRQEHIADLGAVEGCLLPMFFRELPAEIVDAIHSRHWCAISIAARLAFWHELDARLMRLSNRIPADEAARLRACIHARIPEPTSEEIAQLEAWKETAQIDGWGDVRGFYQGRIDRAHGKIALSHCATPWRLRSIHVIPLQQERSGKTDGQK